jgi:hypothetical protein
MPTPNSTFFGFLFAVSFCLTSSGAAHIKPADISFSSIELVEHPAPRSARLEELIGQTPADQASAIMASKELKGRPNRLRLRVNFHSAVDLQSIASRDAIVLLHSYFCLHQKDFAVLSAPTVYSNGRPIHTDSLSDHSTSGESAGGFTYTFYLNAVRRENRNSKPPQMGFDLRVAPENICFYVTGRSATGVVYTSGTAIIPKEAIVAAIDQRRAEASKLDGAN